MAEEKLSLAVLISGRGSNMRALIEACAAPDYPARVSVVIANRQDAAGLELAMQAGIPAEIVDQRTFEDKESFEAALQEKLDAYPVDLICLAGFMRVLSGAFVGHWTDRIINIHPSLLPDYKGLHTHERVLADGRQESGCTVHFVTPELDAGPVILQKKVRVLDHDTPESLAARILEQEHIAYPEAVRMIAEQKEFLQRRT